MSRPCAVAGCDRPSRALCHCCNENLCRNHLAEHDDRLNGQLDPMADEINLLSDRLHSIQSNGLFADEREKIHRWRLNAHRKIDEYADERLESLNRCVRAKLAAHTYELNRLSSITHQLVEEQGTTTGDLKSLSQAIANMKKELVEMELSCFDLNYHQFEINERFIELEDERAKEELDLSALDLPIHVVHRPQETPKALAANHRALLIYQDNELRLLNQDLLLIKQIPWTHGWIWDMCWSARIGRFFIVTLNSVYSLDESSMTLECIPISGTFNFLSCTCSDKLLYVTTNAVASTICEFQLEPTVQFIRQWQHADLCHADEVIQDVKFYRGTLAFIVENQTSHTKRMEVRFATSMERLWVLPFDLVDDLHNAYRLCLFNYDEWIVADWKSSRLIHVSDEGRLRSISPYEQVPYRCCQFGHNRLVIAAAEGINFHHL